MTCPECGFGLGDVQTGWPDDWPTCGTCGMKRRPPEVRTDVTRAEFDALLKRVERLERSEDAP